MSQEIELKLSLPRSALAALRRHPLFAAAPPVGRRQTLINTYFDTPELLLKSHRIALRTRKQGRTWLQTVKCGGEFAGGLSHRPEWEHPYRGAFDFTPVDAPPVRALLEAQQPQLQAVLTTTFRRETRRHRPRDGVEILLMLDVGTIQAAGRSMPLCELELELVAGQARDLFDLALGLAADLPLLPEDISKAQRGYLLLLNQTLAPTKSRPSPVLATDTPLAAFRALAMDGLRQWQANAQGAMVSDNPEFIHQMRAALRRLKSLLRIMAPALPESFVAEWRLRLQAQAHRLGAARDMDVLVATILSPVTSSPEAPPGLQHLHHKAEAARTRVRRQTRNALVHGKPGETLLAFGAALHALGEAPDAPLGSLHDFAHQQLTGLRKRARRRLAEVRAQPGADAFHALRIALKSLRYGLEFFLPLSSPNKARRLLDGIARAQDELGFIHDLAAAGAQLGLWAGRRAELREAAAVVMGWHGQRAQQSMARLPDTVAQLLEMPIPIRKP